MFVTTVCFLFLNLIQFIVWSVKWWVTLLKNISGACCRKRRGGLIACSFWHSARETRRDRKSKIIVLFPGKSSVPWSKHINNFTIFHRNSATYLIFRSHPVFPRIICGWPSFDAHWVSKSWLCWIITQQWYITCITRQERWCHTSLEMR